MTMNLSRLQLAVNDAAFHRSRTAEAQKKPMEEPAAVRDVRFLYRGPEEYVRLERWIKSFKDTRRRDWGKIQKAIAALDNADRTEGFCFVLRQGMAGVPECKLDTLNDSDLNPFSQTTTQKDTAT